MTQNQRIDLPPTEKEFLKSPLIERKTPWNPSVASKSQKFGGQRYFALRIMSEIDDESKHEQKRLMARRQLIAQVHKRMAA